MSMSAGKVITRPSNITAGQKRRYVATAILAFFDLLSAATSVGIVATTHLDEDFLVCRCLVTFLKRRAGARRTA